MIRAGTAATISLEAASNLTTDGSSESGGKESLSYISGATSTEPGAEGTGGDEMSGMDAIVADGAASGEGANARGGGGGGC